MKKPFTLTSSFDPNKTKCGILSPILWLEKLRLKAS